MRQRVGSRPTVSVFRSEEGEAGFRGYAYKQNHRWRVALFVETDDGREIGRLNFVLREPSREPEMLPREQISR